MISLKYMKWGYQEHRKFEQQKKYIDKMG